MKKISIITINYNTPEMTEKAVRTAAGPLSGFEREIIVVDNGSKNKVQPDNFKDMPIQIIYNRENKGFAAAVNQGIKRAAGDYLLLINSDLFISGEAVLKMAGYMEENPRTGIIAPKLVYPDARPQNSFGSAPSLLNEFSRFFKLAKIFCRGTVTYRNFLNKEMFVNGGAVGWVSGACMLIRREVIEKAGLMDEQYFFGVEDMDYCFQAKKANLDVIYFPLSSAVHLHGFSAGGWRSIKRLRQEREGINYFYRKNFAKRRLSRKLIYLMHGARIGCYIVKNYFQR